ncbi:helix-turn-helix transcriptional regulator [Streptomyces sp. NPDC001034]|uniref:helix-turn-helix domain-containing protein n=1 Tax=Streptomyces sp. NPDC001034 TaxID=3154375 RepID=UPI003331481C
MAGVTQDPEAWARLGAKIRERREAMGLSRRQLSEAAGVSEKSIQTAEEGRMPRARWPQSLRLIENSLRWEAGSVERILEGGEPGGVHDLLSLFESEPEQQAPVQTETEFLAAAHARSQALATLPNFLRKSLREVLMFGAHAVAFGADGELAARYEEALDALLLDMTSRPLEYQGMISRRHTERLILWTEALDMDPIQRKEKEDELEMMENKSRRLRETLQRTAVFPPRRTRVVRKEASGELAEEVRRLSEEVSRLAKRLDNAPPSAGDA